MGMARSFFRVVKSNPPTPDDFKSYHELRMPVLRHDPQSRRLAEGLSVYATLAQARRAARSQPFLGQFVAELIIPENAPLTFERTGKKAGHHTIWCDPPDAFVPQALKCLAS